VKRNRKKKVPQPVLVARRLVGRGGQGVVIETKDSRNELSYAVVRRLEDGKAKLTYVVGNPLKSEREAASLKEQWPQFSDRNVVVTTNFDALIEDLLDLPTKGKKVELTVSSVIIPERKTTEGVLIKATSVVWSAMVEELKTNWSKAYEIPPHMWEELIAGAFVKAGFDEVILTPRSGDHGRDVIAVRNGIGSIRILGSVKAYRPGHLVTKEEVHALMGVVNLDPNASKGIITTTSDFAPRLLRDSRLAQAVPHRIELMNGVELKAWLQHLSLMKQT
jgi:restriction system protein